ncbi:MAG: hypothetical protein IPO90_08980 [Flavobacteriales bacterium]|nr:hypothetical protein [Flavobacteriales bacterium]
MYLIKTNENGVILGQAESEIRQLPQASVIPDPVTDRAAIRFPNPQWAEVSFFLFNAFGQTVREIRFGATDRIMLDRQGLPSGEYQFLIGAGTKRLAQGRLILK